MTKTYRFVLTGLGNIGRTFLEVLQSRETMLREWYGLELQPVGVADSTGVAYDPRGLDGAGIAALKRAGRSLRDSPHYRPDLDPVTVLQTADADLLCEATPTNLQDGMPGLGIVRSALQLGVPAVLASKGPLVLAYGELAALSDLSGDAARPALRFSGAVGGALPSINIGRRDLAGSRIDRVEMVVNGTTQVILQLMADGQPFPQALAAAQTMGIVEPDPALDVDGWDAANKLVILAKSWPMPYYAARRSWPTCRSAALAT